MDGNQVVSRQVIRLLIPAFSLYAFETWVDECSWRCDQFSFVVQSSLARQDKQRKRKTATAMAIIC
jgi:hypothetical protein